MTTSSVVTSAQVLSNHFEPLTRRYAISSHIIIRMAMFLGDEKPVSVDAENHLDQGAGTFSGQAVVFTSSRVIYAQWTNSPEDGDVSDTPDSSTATVRTFSRSKLSSLSITPDGEGGANVDADWDRVYIDNNCPRRGRLTLRYDIEGVPVLHLPFLLPRRADGARDALLSLTSELLADLR